MKKKIPCVFALLFCAVFLCTAEILSSPSWSYMLDLPEGFELADKSGTTKYLFSNTVVPAELVIALYPSDAYGSAEDALLSAARQIHSSGETASFSWRHRQCAVSSLSFSLPGGTAYEGWGTALELSGKRGFLVMLSYAPQDRFRDCEPIIVSALDAVFTDRGSLYEAGPMTAFAFPPEGDIICTVEIDGKKTDAVLDKADAEANQYVIDREFDVLKKYADTPLWKEAWERYYRAIYRDAYKRLSRTAFALYNTLAAQRESPPRPYELFETLLGWVQDLPYGRDRGGSDFTSLPAALAGAQSDCDSRALLLAILLRHMNCETALFISREYSHAFAGVETEGQGARLTAENGIQYLLGETTAHVKPGQIPADMSDAAAWTAVIFP